MIAKPTTLPDWAQTYLAHVPETELISGFKNQTPITLNFFAHLNDDQLDYRYAEGKWNLREILLHIIDTERVFCYRAMCFARKDKTPLPGFDENAYVANSNANSRSIRSLLEEYAVVRTATVALFTGFSPEVMDQTGIANGKEISVAALGFIALGHERHHLKVIEERYLNAQS